MNTDAWNAGGLQRCFSTALAAKMSNVQRVAATDASIPGTTCCGKTERCETPPCSLDNTCRRDNK